MIDPNLALAITFSVLFLAILAGAALTAWRDDIEVSWTLFKWRLEHRLGDLGRWFIWRLPDRVVYWCCIRAMSHAASVHSGRNYPLETITPAEVLKAWEERA